MQRLLLIAVLVGSLHARCIAQLQPDEVAVVAARGNPDSEALARYYAQARKLPPENVCLVNMPAGEICPYEAWHADIRPQIHKWLATHDSQEKIRCVVTVWGVPLKISARTARREIETISTIPRHGTGPSHRIAHRRHRLVR